MTGRSLVAAVLAIALGAVATTGSSAEERPKSSSPRQEGIVRVQVAIQLFVTGPTDESEEAERQRERARRALYELAAKECDLMREVLARDCRLESVNVNLNRQVNPQMQGYAVNGSMSYQITLK